jgi:hypothetical protein
VSTLRVRKDLRESRLGNPGARVESLQDGLSRLVAADVSRPARAFRNSNVIEGAPEALAEGHPPFFVGAKARRRCGASTTSTGGSAGGAHVRQGAGNG